MRQAKPTKSMPLDDSLEQLLTIPGVAELLQVSRRKVYLLIGEGLPVIHFGKSVRVRPASLRRWLASREYTA
jgi:excisionase family DNA binding protein